MPLNERGCTQRDLPVAVVTTVVVLVVVTWVVVLVVAVVVVVTSGGITVWMGKVSINGPT